ncbi:unnamed protein product [Microthlaspi erraticum]|uniref:Uncharacterized protein n=1 Tax=Microthlaspi erraticum TaxID=1685480 RepID=A0A6D2LKZ6_9BRAS|nr:unnamed protein product [Microthlaspi erraticum]
MHHSLVIVRFRTGEVTMENMVRLYHSPCMIWSSNMQIQSFFVMDAWILVPDVESGFTKLLDLCKCTDRGSMGIEPRTGYSSGFTKLLDLCKCTDRGSMGIEHKDWLLSTL